MSLSLVSMENIVSQGSMNSRQEKAEELEKLGNRAAAAEPGQLGKGRSGMVPIPVGFPGGQLARTGCMAAADSWGFQRATVARPQVIFINPHPCKGRSPKSPLEASLGSHHRL